MNKFPLLFVAALIFSFTTLAQTAVVTGELKKFHKVTLTWQGADFTEEATTFKDYRLNITFLSPSGLTYVVPGYYAADGIAAESSATSGDKWRCHFNALEAGTWSYTTSFRTADDIAVSFDPLLGNPVLGIDGDTGTFEISETDKSGIDFRAKGKLEYVGEHFLQWTNGEYFLKLGTNSPEVFLEYIDFDNTPVNTNFTNLIPRDYAPHVPDWNTGDPVWKSTKGKGIIGAVNYLSNQGINSHYFLTDSSYGDTDTVYPWVSLGEHYIYDTSKLDQWQIVFDHMMSKGVQVHFVLSEAEQQSLFELFSDFEGDDPTFANARKIYYREMVARFGYLNAITWNIGEENGWDRPTETYGRALSSAQQIAFADYLKNLIYYDDHITLQNGHANDDSIFKNLIGNNELTGASLQGVAWNTERSRASVLNWREKSELSGRKWVVNYDEAYHSRLTGVPLFRQNALWSSLTAGAAGFEFYTPAQDWRVQDYKDYEEYWTSMRYAGKFFADNKIPFHEMESKDQMLSNGWCFGKDYEVYVIYLPTQGTTTANIIGEYAVKWFDPRNGGPLLEGSISTVSNGSNVSLGLPPNNPDLDWVVLLQTVQTGPVDVTGMSVTPATLSIGNGQSIHITGNVIPKNADNTGFTWSSSNSSVASVDINGQVTAHSVGEASITATSDEGGFTDSSAVTVLDSSNFCNATGTILMERYDGIPGSDISSLINAPSYPDNPTSSLELDEFQIPSNAADEYGTRLTGYLCAPENGTYYFWIAGDDNSQLSISTDANPLNSTTIAFHNSWTNSRQWDKFPTQKSVGIELAIGQTYYIEAIMKEGGGGDNLAVAWRKPSDGDRNIPFEVIPGIVLSSSLPVPVPVTGVAVNPTSVSLDNGETSQLTATVVPSGADNSMVSWSSNDTNVATVDSNGLVTATGQGTAIITVTTEDGDFTAMATITVTAIPISVTGVTVNPTSVSLDNGETSQLTATVVPSGADNSMVSWSSNDTNVATVDSNGLVTATGQGTAIITVTTEDGDFTAMATITVTAIPISVTGVTVNPTSVSLDNGETSQLTATVVPSGADNSMVSWSSNDTNVATVDSNGLVTATGQGTAIITVTTEDGDFTAMATITVTAIPISVTGVTVNPTSVSLDNGETSQLTATVVPLGADNSMVSWSSNDTNVATVDSNGLVTATGQGTAIITVTTADGYYTTTSIISIEELNVLSDVIPKVYPNPVENIAHMLFPESKLANRMQVYDATGRLVLNMEREDFEIQDGVIQFSVLPLKNGTYFVHIPRGSLERIEFRLIVKK